MTPTHPTGPLSMVSSPTGRAPADPAALKALLAEPDAPTWVRRPLGWALVAAALVAAGGWWAWHSRSAANAAPAYTTHAVARGNLTLTVTANGTLQPTRAITIGSELSGIVRQVNVDVNDRIKKGQVLVVLDTAKLNDQILRSGAALTAAAARVAQAEATLTEATAHLARLNEVAQLSGGQVPSKAELDTGRAALARAQGEHTSARAGVSDAQAALSTDRITLSRASITAPADGVVLTRTVEPGNAVAASLQAVTLLTMAEDLSRLRLWVYVDEADVGAVKVGQLATFTVSAHLARRFPARITRVGFGSTVTDNVVTYLTHLEVDNADLSLRPGMTATATIAAVERKDVIRVPNAALRFTPTVVAEAMKKNIASGMVMGPPKVERRSAATDASTALARQVWVLPDNGGQPVAVAVMPGISDGRMTEIVSGDLRVGMDVITDQKVAASP